MDRVVEKHGASMIARALNDVYGQLLNHGIPRGGGRAILVRLAAWGTRGSRPRRGTTVGQLKWNIMGTALTAPSTRLTCCNSVFGVATFSDFSDRGRGQVGSGGVFLGWAKMGGVRGGFGIKKKKILFQEEGKKEINEKK